MVWEKGKSGNPAGMPRGARKLVTDSFIRECARAWDKHGVKVLERLAKEKPDKFASLIAGLVPKEIDMGEGFESVSGSFMSFFLSQSGVGAPLGTQQDAVEVKKDYVEESEFESPPPKVASPPKKKLSARATTKRNSTARTNTANKKTSSKKKTTARSRCK